MTEGRKLTIDALIQEEKQRIVQMNEDAARDLIRKYLTEIVQAQATIKAATLRIEALKDSLRKINVQDTDFAGV